MAAQCLLSPRRQHSSAGGCASAFCPRVPTSLLTAPLSARSSFLGFFGVFFFLLFFSRGKFHCAIYSGDSSTSCSNFILLLMQPNSSRGPGLCAAQRCAAELLDLLPAVCALFHAATHQRSALLPLSRINESAPSPQLRVGSSFQAAAPEPGVTVPWVCRAVLQPKPSVCPAVLPVGVSGAILAVGLVDQQLLGSEAPAGFRGSGRKVLHPMCVCLQRSWLGQPVLGVCGQRGSAQGCSLQGHAGVLRGAAGGVSTQGCCIRRISVEGCAVGLAQLLGQRCSRCSPSPWVGRCVWAPSPASHWGGSCCQQIL